ncbi:hypothetical protein [Nonomuraea sp. NPDC046570]|uniref:hypothetical protein n=1 Tax=Nonomuraea sp. NPDC046570 TaxID=3155255 RepID=UPI003405D130
MLPGADHELLRSPDGFENDGRLVAGYDELVTSWIHRLGERHEPSADPPPHQDLVSAPVTPLAWWESAPVQVAALLLMAAAFLAYPIGALARRPRGPRGSAVLAATGSVTVVGTVLYLGYLLATAAEAPGPALLGRPLVWLVLQLLALVAIAATVAVLLGLRRQRLTVRPILLAAGGVLLVPWALYWGLLLP